MFLSFRRRLARWWLLRKLERAGLNIFEAEVFVDVLINEQLPMWKRERVASLLGWRDN